MTRCVVGQERRRRRRQRRPRQPQGELNIVSMIDVFAVLVFFLLVGSSISAGKLHALKLDMPGASTADAESQRRDLTVTLREDGDLQISDRGGRLAHLPARESRYDIAGLATALARIKAEDPAETRLILRVAADVAYEHVVEVMDAIRQNAGSGSQREWFPAIALGDASTRSAQP